jgi:hypothetical protein
VRGVVPEKYAKNDSYQADNQNSEAPNNFSI